MIVYLSGKPLITETTTAVLVGGVGYGVFVTPSTRLQMKGMQDVILYVYSHVKEECFDLYAFLNEGEKLLFTKLIDVDGIGPKTAIGIMDKGVEAIIHAVQTADVSFFQSIPRVGKKSAQKIIIDLKNKLGGKEDLNLQEPEGKAKEVVEALTSLGFSETDSVKVAKTLSLDTLRVEDAVKQAIRTLTAHKG
jgi:holliday junction DNA helicase RuvA